jgi:hypothetical protein
VDLGRFFSFFNLYTVGRTPWTGDHPVARPLPTHNTTRTHNKRTQISMPRVGFKPMIPVLERAKTVYALDRAVTVTAWNLKKDKQKGCGISRIILVRSRGKGTVNKMSRGNSTKRREYDSSIPDDDKGCIFTYMPIIVLNIRTRWGPGAMHKLQEIDTCSALF